MPASGRSWLALGAIGVATAISTTPATAEAAPGEGGGRYRDVCDHAFPFHCLARRRLPADFRPLGPGGGGSGGTDYCTCGTANPCGGGASSPSNDAMAPGDVIAAYQIPASTSAGGKIVAIIDMPDATALADVNVYRKAFQLPELPQCPGNGLPVPGSGTPCFAAVDENGAVTSSAGDCPTNDAETGLDMEMVSAGCPDCSLVLVQMTGASTTNGPTVADFIQATRSAIGLGADAISMSFGGAELDVPTGNNYTTPGHLVLAASGDAGYLNELQQQAGQPLTPTYPSSAPDVLSVGGTTLTTNGAQYGEVVWNDGVLGGAGGSGCSTVEGMPSFQSQFLSTSPGAFGSCTMRATTDVAAIAEFKPARGGGIAEYDSVDGWIETAGTSAASPLMAGLLTRLGVTGLISGNLGWVYENTSGFNDITSGDNDPGQTCTSVLCQAGPGWDGPTGVGTPNGPALATLALTGGNSGPSPTAAKAGCGCALASHGGIDLALAGAAGMLLGLALRRRRRSVRSPSHARS